MGYGRRKGGLNSAQNHDSRRRDPDADAVQDYWAGQGAGWATPEPEFAAAPEPLQARAPPGGLITL